MPKIEIDSPGVTIRIDDEATTIDDLARLALALYRDAGGWPQPTAGSVGFTAERSYGPEYVSSHAVDLGRTA